MVDDSEEHASLRRKASRGKSIRTTLLAVLFQVSWPQRLTSREILAHLPFYGEGDRPRALHRDIETLTGCQLSDLPESDDPRMEQW